MTNRILLALVAIGLAALLVGGATAALLTAKTSSTGGSAQAGTIALSASGLATWSNPDRALWSMPIAEMAPGQRATASVTVTNTGTLDLKYRVTPTLTGGLAGKVEVTLGPTPINLAPGASQTLTVEVLLPANADSSARSKTGTLKLMFEATQPANTGWSP